MKEKEEEDQGEAKQEEVPQSVEPQEEVPPEVVTQNDVKHEEVTRELTPEVVPQEEEGKQEEVVPAQEIKEDDKTVTKIFVV